MVEKSKERRCKKMAVYRWVDDDDDDYYEDLRDFLDDNETYGLIVDDED